MFNWQLTPTELAMAKEEFFMETATDFLEEYPDYAWIFNKLKIPEDMSVIARTPDVISSFGKIFPVEFVFCPYNQLATHVNRIKAFEHEVDDEIGIYVKDHFDGKYTLYIGCEDNDMRFVDMIALLKVMGTIVEVEHARATKSKPRLMDRKTSLRMAGLLLGADGTEQGIEAVVMEAEAKKLVSWINGIWISMLLGIEPYIMVNGIMEDEIDSIFPDLMTDDMWNSLLEVITNSDLAKSMFKVAGEHYSPKHAFHLDVLQTGLPVDVKSLLKQIDRATLLLLGDMYEKQRNSENNEENSNVDSDSAQETLEYEVPQWPLKELVHIAMKDQGLSAQQVSEKSGVPLKSIELFLCELVPIQLNDLILICKVINVDLKGKLAELKIALHELTSRNALEDMESNFLVQLIGMLGLELDKTLKKLTIQIGSRKEAYELIITARSYRLFMETIQKPVDNFFVPVEAMDMSVFINVSEIKSYSFESVEYADDYVTKGFDHLYSSVNILYKQAEDNIAFKVNPDEPSIEYYRDGNVGDCLITLLGLDAEDICTFKSSRGEVIGISRAQVSMIAVDHVVTHPNLIKTNSAAVH